jgi:hypothetical protein
VALALLAAGGSARGGPQAFIQAPASAVVSGQRCQLRVQVPDWERPAPSHGPDLGPDPGALPWVWSLVAGPGAIEPESGLFVAPEVAQPVTVRVRARLEPEGAPGIETERVLLVLPFEPFDLVGRVLGTDWAESFSSEHPFLDLATEARQAPPDRVRSQFVPPDLLPDLQHAAPGIPFTLTWTRVQGVQAELLSYREGHDLVRLDVSGQAARELTLWRPVSACMVESLGVGPAGTWVSVVQPCPIRVHGLLPFAGNPMAAPGHRDGPGLSARFREPFGLARVRAPGPGPSTHSWFLVSDPGSHVIRMVSEAGAVTTPWGEPDQPGFQDPGSSGLSAWARSLCLGDRLGDEPGSRFRGPTFLHAWKNGNSIRAAEWQCLVSDSGNHAIRVLRAGGKVATLAGSPGLAGYQDSIFSCRARFNDPQGLAEDSLGNLYVADRGNHVIRRIGPGGVSTLAGAPGQPGTRDGQGRSAQFSALRGLASHRLAGGEVLHAVDGHAIRRITLPDGQVTTPLGIVATPGFEDATGEDREAALRRPCLNRPCGIQAMTEGLLIADEGNHCLRSWRFETSSLTTCLGSPGQGETRWGLVWPDLGVPADDRFASVAAPRTLVSVPPYQDAVILTTGAGLAEFHPGRAGRAPLGPISLSCGAAGLAQACGVTFSVDLKSPGSIRPIHYTVDFLEPDGTLAERVRGTGRSSAPMAAQGQFCQRGTGAVVVRCVTDQGVCAGIRKAVEVR